MSSFSRSIFFLKDAAALTVGIALSGCAAPAPRFDEARLLEAISTLSSDDFGGRAPVLPARS